MKAWTVYPLWAWCEAMGVKRVENKKARPDTATLRPGAQLAIHAGKNLGRMADYRWVERNFQPAVPPSGHIPFGAVLAVTQLLGVVRIVPRKSGLRTPPTVIKVELGAAGTEGMRRARQLVMSPTQWPWLEGPVVWVLEEPVCLSRPVPCRGQQGIFELPAEVAAEVSGLYEQAVRLGAAKARKALEAWEPEGGWDGL